MKNQTGSKSTKSKKITNFNQSQNQKVMKTFSTFQEVQRTEKAILVKTNVEELNQELSFWLPLSKVEISENILSVPADVWEKKLAELKEPKEVENIKVFSNVYDKGEKATKLSVNVKVPNQDDEKEFWVFIPNSQISNVEKDNDKFKVTLPQWLWEKSFSNSVQYQLDNFYNKDKEDNLYKIEDFILLSSTSKD